MARIELYTTDWCGYCTRAKQLLRAKGVEYDEIDVTEDTEQEAMMRVRSSRRTVPQIFIDGAHVGGFAAAPGRGSRADRIRCGRGRAIGDLEHGHGHPAARR